MKAAVVYEYGTPIEVVDVTPGSVGPNDVRIKVKASGLCHSDVACQTGELPFPLPMILGHEGSGIVVEAGDAVTTCAVGDHVVLSALIHCGVCDNCLKGRPNLCMWGLETIFGGTNPDGTLRAHDPEGRELYQFSSIGTLAEELICSEKHAVPIPADVPLESACLTGCGVLTGTSAVFNRARVEPGSSVVVIGCGGVGLNVVQGAVHASAGKIIAVDCLRAPQPRCDCQSGLQVIRRKDHRAAWGRFRLYQIRRRHHGFRVYLVCPQAPNQIRSRNATARRGHHQRTPR